MRFVRGFRVPFAHWMGSTLLGLALLARTGFAQSAAISLDIQPGARQNGLGAAGVALFGDPSDALWWNPAALGFAGRTSLQYTHATLLPELADLPYHHVALATRLGSFGGLGASFTRADIGVIDSFLYPADESSPAIALGVRVHPMVAVGASLKWVNLWYGTFFGVAHGETFTADVGALVRVERKPWTFGFGATYQNLDGSVDFGGGPTPLGRNWKLGASATIPVRLNDQVGVGYTAVLDYNQAAEFQTWNGGVEVHLIQADILRLAARGGYYHDPSGNIRDFTYGGGIRAAMLAADAAWIPQARDSGYPRVLKVTAGIHVDFTPYGPRWSMD
jgi:hypothetical protein